MNYRNYRIIHAQLLCALVFVVCVSNCVSALSPSQGVSMCVCVWLPRFHPSILTPMENLFCISRRFVVIVLYFVTLSTSFLYDPVNNPATHRLLPLQLFLIVALLSFYSCVCVCFECRVVFIGFMFADSFTWKFLPFTKDMNEGSPSKFKCKCNW